MAIQGNFLSNEINKNTISILRNRSTAYKNGGAGGSNALQWLNNRRAGFSVTVTSKDKTVKRTLSTYVRGGLSGIYTKTNNVYRPRPVLNDLTVDTAGTLGSLQEGKFTFSVFNQSQLSEYSAFLQLGNTIDVTGQWVGAPDDYADTFKFSGIIHNFSFTLTQNGGFDCTVNFTGPGIAFLGATTKLAFYLPDATLPGVANGVYVTLPTLLEVMKTIHLSTTAAESSVDINNIINRDLSIPRYSTNNFVRYAPSYANYVGQFKDSAGTKWEEYDESNNIFSSGIGDLNSIVSVTVNDAIAYGVAPKDTQGASPSGVSNISKFVSSDGNLLNSGKITYITLSGFISLMEALLKKAGGTEFNRIKLNGAVIPTANMPLGLTSLNWTELILPGTISWYSAATDNSSQTYESGGGSAIFTLADINNLDSTNNSGQFTVNGSGGCRMLIGIDWLISEYETFASRRQSTDGNIQDYSIRFINQVFDMIARNTANFFKFTMVQNPKNRDEWIVVNNCYVPTPQSFLYQLPVQTNGGVATNISLTGKLPTDLQTSAFVNNRNGTAITGVGPSNIQQIQSGGALAGDAESSQPPDNEELRSVLSNYYTKGLTTETIEAARGVLSRLVNFNLGVTNSSAVTTTASTKYAQLVPLELTLSFEGIAGLEFGNAFTINYIPDSLTPANGVYFTISKVTQKFSSDGTWSTDVSTLMRIANLSFTAKSI